MSYRLHASIPNTEEDFITLGKQYEPEWVEFNDKWFGADNDSGLISHEELLDFYNELKEINDKFDDSKQYKLDNLDEFKRLVDKCIKNKHSMYFVSF